MNKFFRQKPFVIAEIGNNHFGCMKSAKEHIRVAKLAGATACKLQAFNYKDIKGSMPPEFYNKCQFSIEQYLELIEYGKLCSIPVFYSVFSEGFQPLLDRQMFFKISASQNQHNESIYTYGDHPNLFVSFNKQTVLNYRPHSQILYATDYMPEKIDIDYIEVLKTYFKRRVGISDHHIGVDACIEAYWRYEVNVIEKHFTLKKNRKFKGKVFRDTVHGMNHRELERLVRVFK